MIKSDRSTSEMSKAINEIKNMVSALNLKIDCGIAKNGVFDEPTNVSPLVHVMGLNSAYGLRFRHGQIDFSIFRGLNPGGWIYHCK